MLRATPGIADEHLVALNYADLLPAAARAASSNRGGSGNCRQDTVSGTTPRSGAAVTGTWFATGRTRELPRLSPPEL
jgi:hypothetical protein